MYMCALNGVCISNISKGRKVNLNLSDKLDKLAFPNYTTIYSRP
jgi:hypothetical protein